jgi:hypothetical protein
MATKTDYEAAAVRCGWYYCPGANAWVAVDTEAYPDEAYETAEELCMDQGIDP